MVTEIHWHGLLNLDVPQHPHRACRMLPSDTPLNRWLHFLHLGLSVELGPCTIRCDYAATKPAFSLALFLLFNCSCPQADWVLQSLLSLSHHLASPKRGHLSDSVIVNRPANSLVLSLMVVHFDWICFSITTPVIRPLPLVLQILSNSSVFGIPK